MQTITQLSVFLENRVGQLARACAALAEADVSLMALTIAGAPDFGIARMVADSSSRAAEALRKAKFIVRETPVVALALPDRPGALGGAVSLLAGRGCSVEYAYALAVRPAGKAVLVMRFADDGQAAAAIADAGFDTLGEADLAG